MGTYSDKLTFKLPSRAQVALTDDLVRVISDHHKKSRDHLFHLCMIAYGLRTHNLTKSKTGAGGNAQGRLYKPVFKEWYEKNNLVDVYGTLSNFTLYAMSGRLLEYVRWQMDEKYIPQLPSSLTALYALSQILWSQGESATTTSRKLFDKAMIKPIKDGSKHNTFVHPHVTRKEIEAWFDKETGKTSAKSTSQKKQSTDHTITLATIKVHRDLLKFAKNSGKKIGNPKFEDVVNLDAILKEVVKNFDSGKAKFIVESNLEDVHAEYEEAKNPNFARKILDD